MIPMHNFLITLLIITTLQIVCNPYNGTHKKYANEKCVIRPSAMELLSGHRIGSARGAERNELLNAFEKGEWIDVKGMHSSNDDFIKVFMQPRETGIASDDFYVVVELKNANDFKTQIYFLRDDDDFFNIDGTSNDHYLKKITGNLDGEVVSMPFEISFGIYAFKTVFSNGFTIVEAKTLNHKKNNQVPPKNKD